MNIFNEYSAEQISGGNNILYLSILINIEDSVNIWILPMVIPVDLFSIHLVKLHRRGILIMWI